MAVSGYSTSASFSLLSVALRIRARALERAGAACALLGWTSHPVLLGAGAARLLLTCVTRGREKRIFNLGKFEAMLDDV